VTYAIGDQVDHYVLTKGGWVPQLDLDTSPFRPGHVVNDAILTADLQWVPLRTSPSVPYRVGDVVDSYVLVPSGDWVPLAGQLRDRSGAKVAPAASPAATKTPEPRRTASARTTHTQTRPHVADQPVPQAHRQAQALTHQVRTQTPSHVQPGQLGSYQPGSQQPPPYSPAQQPGPGRPFPPAHQPGPAPQYRIGQVVDGHVLTADRGWVPIPEQAARSTGSGSGVGGRFLFGLVVLIVLVALRACAG